MSALSDEEMEELGSAVVWAADLDEDSLVELSDEEKDVLIDEMDAVATDRKSTRLNSSHTDSSRMPSSA